MFIFCKVKEKGKQCLIQSWAFKSPFEQVYVCPVHGFVDADGNKYDEVDINGERFRLMDKKEMEFKKRMQKFADEFGVKIIEIKK